jgi:hypothetical protein
MTYAPPEGDVARWHSHPDSRLRLSGDTINSHQQRCVYLLLQILPNASKSLIEAVRYHDEAERWIGDMPYMAKHDFPDLADALRVAEYDVMKTYNIPEPESTFERSMLKIVDRLDAYIWMMTHAPDLGERTEWIAALNSNLDNADMFMLGDKVREIIENVKRNIVK